MVVITIPYISCAKFCLQHEVKTFYQNKCNGIWCSFQNSNRHKWSFSVHSPHTVFQKIVLFQFWKDYLICIYTYIYETSKYKSILCWCCFLDLINNTIFLKVQNVIDREMRYINKETSPKTAIPIYHIIWYGFVCFMGNKCLDEKYCKYATPYVNLCSRHMDDAMLWHLI